MAYVFGAKTSSGITNHEWSHFSVCRKSARPVFTSVLVSTNSWQKDLALYLQDVQHSAPFASIQYRWENCSNATAKLTNSILMSHLSKYDVKNCKNVIRSLRPLSSCCPLPPRLTHVLWISARENWSGPKLIGGSAFTSCSWPGIEIFYDLTTCFPLKTLYKIQRIVPAAMHWSKSLLLKIKIQCNFHAPVDILEPYYLPRSMLKIDSLRHVNVLMGVCRLCMHFNTSCLSEERQTPIDSMRVCVLIAFFLPVNQAVAMFFVLVASPIRTSFALPLTLTPQLYLTVNTMQYACTK